MLMWNNQVLVLIQILKGISLDIKTIYWRNNSHSVCGKTSMEFPGPYVLSTLIISPDDTFVIFKNIIYIRNGPAFVLIC